MSETEENPELLNSYKKVYIVGWSSRTSSEIFLVFENPQEAEEYRKKIVAKLAPTGSQMDYSWLIERPFVLENEGQLYKNLPPSE